MRNSSVNERGEALPTKSWLVLYTKPKWEKKIATELEAMGFEIYCPHNKVYKKWTDRIKIVFQPLFSMYVFVNVTEHEKWKPLEVNGALNYIRNNGKPAIVRTEEINDLKNFLMDNESVEIIHTNDFKKGENVVVAKGIFSSNTGKITQVANNRVEVTLSSLSCTIRAVFHPSQLKKQNINNP